MILDPTVSTYHAQEQLRKASARIDEAWYSIRLSQAPSSSNGQSRVSCLVSVGKAVQQRVTFWRMYLAAGESIHCTTGQSKASDDLLVIRICLTIEANETSSGHATLFSLHDPIVSLNLVLRLKTCFVKAYLHDKLGRQQKDYCLLPCSVCSTITLSIWMFAEDSTSAFHTFRMLYYFSSVPFLYQKLQSIVPKPIISNLKTTIPVPSFIHLSRRFQPTLIVPLSPAKNQPEKWQSLLPVDMQLRLD